MPAGLLQGEAGQVLAAPQARADGPGQGAPYAATLGDSYISGEAGRWAGSSNSSSTAADALGRTAYYDNATHTAEQINRCHRSASAEAYIGGGVNGVNFACSGATTSTTTGTDYSAASTSGLLASWSAANSRETPIEKPVAGTGSGFS